MRNLRAEITRRGLTAKKLAILINMPVSTFHKKIQGYSDFTIPEAFAISKVLDGLEIEYLFAKGDQNAESSK